MKDGNVLIITDYAAPYEGNFIESLKILEKELKKSGTKMIYLFPPKAKDKNCVIDLKKNNHKLFFGSENVKENIKIIRKIIKSEQISIIYSHFCSLKTQTQVKLIRVLNRKIKLVCHFHNHFKLEGRFPRKPLTLWAFKGDLNIGCSESVKNSIPYKNSIYIDNAINFKRLENYRDIKIKELENKYVILMFGFDYYRKGVDIAIKAIKECSQKDIILAILLATNKQKVEKIVLDEFGEIPDFIRFLDPIDDIATYYRKADIFLTPSREEGLCYSVIEAAYCKTIIVNSDIPGISKGIPGEYIFENENYIDLKDKINEIYNSKKDEEVLNSAHEYVKEKYSIKKWAESIKDTLFM